MRKVRKRSQRKNRKRGKKTREIFFICKFPLDTNLQLELVKRESKRVNLMISKVFDLPNNSAVRLLDEQTQNKRQTFEVFICVT
jgi:hypothetical protein